MISWRCKYGVLVGGGIVVGGIVVGGGLFGIEVLPLNYYSSHLPFQGHGAGIIVLLAVGAKIDPDLAKS